MFHLRLAVSILLVSVILSSVPASAQYDGFVPEKLNFEWLLSTIKTKNLTSIEDVLQEMPEAYMSAHVLMYESRSVQRASFENPRVILFGSDASFITAFNGDPQHAGHDRLEIIQFRKAERRFEFREIVFRDGKAPDVSGPNPPKCLSCHQSPARMDVDPRPNWEPYSKWPGAYDHIYTYPSLRKYERNEIEAAVASVPHMKEALLANHGASEGYAAFKKNALGHPRYKLLNLTDSEVVSLGNVVGLKGPLAFTARVAQLNFQRVARLAMQTPFYDRYKFSLMSSLYNRAPSLPPGVLNWHMARFVRPPVQKYNGLRATFGEDVSMIFHPLGISTEDWSMDFDSAGGLLAFQFRFGTPGDPPNELIRVFTRFDPQWKVPAPTALFDKAEKALAGYQPMPVDLSSSHATTRMMCARCHSADSGMRAPRISFEDPGRLREELNRPGYPRGSLLDEMLFRLGETAPRDERMPPVGSLLDEQKRVFVEYLKGLAQ